MNKEQQELIDEAYEKYSIIAGMSTQVLSFTKGWFLRQIKFNPKFSETWGLKIEERELVVEERVKWAYDSKLIDYVTMVENEILDKHNTPTKLITITYNNKTIESYE